MTHYMKLKPLPFEMIKSGNKTIELRLFDEKRQKISPCDSIEFTNTQTGEVIKAEVIDLYRFDSFKELYESLPLTKCGYTADDVDSAHYTDMNEYYSECEQERYGVVGIELSLMI